MAGDIDSVSVLFETVYERMGRLGPLKKVQSIGIQVNLGKCLRPNGVQGSLTEDAMRDCAAVEKGCESVDVNKGYADIENYCVNIEKDSQNRNICQASSFTIASRQM